MKSIGGVLGTLGSILLMASVWSVGLTAEIPLGGVHGVVTMEPSKKPLPNAEVILSPRFEVPEDSKNTWIVRTDSLGRYDVRSLPAGNYSVNVYGKSYSTQDERLSLVIQEGKSATYDVKTTRLYADLQMSASQRVYLPEEKPKLTLSGFTDEESARFQVYKVPYESVFEKRDPATVVRSIVANRNVVEPNSMSGLEITFDENRNLTRKDAEGEFVEQVDLPSLPIGLYVVRGKVGKETKYQWLSVTSLALVTKAQGNHVLAYVTDLKTGVPVLGARISYANKASLIPAGATDANGLLEFVRGADMSTGLDDNETKLVIADHSGSRAFTWFYSGSDSNAGKTAFWVQTDRPVYRPGDTVHYKVVARTDLGRTYEVPNGQVSVQVMDSDENVVGQQSLTLTPFGSVSGDFRIDGQAMPEPYRLKLSHGASSDFHDVPVMAYRKPEYIVTVRSKSKSVIRGDSVEFKVHVESYTGEPAAGQKLTATPYVRPDWSYTPFEDDYVENDGYDYLGDMLPALESVTNDQGDATLLVPTTGPESEALDATDSTMTLEVVAEDPGGRGTDGKGAVRVVRGEFSLAVMPDRYMAEPGQQVTLTINGKWNEDGQALVGQSVDIETGHFRWTGNSSVFVREGLDKVSLDSSGQVGYSWNPQTTGESIARISAKDKRGNTVLSEVVVWGSAPGSSPAGPVPDLSLTLDKPSYLPTDSARALVRTNRPGGAALMTVEAEGVLWKSVVKLSESTTIVPIPQVDAYAPAATVSLSYVVDKSYLSAQRTIKVDLVQKRLKVELTPSSKVLQPGGSVVFQVKTTDEATGATVPSEVAVGVVDESIYAISEDVNDPVKSFYPRRWSTVQTAYSFPEIYLDGDEKNPVAPKVRKDFRDTAYWNPTVLTDSSGLASVVVRLPDNLTQWRATATAFSHDTRIGKSKANVTAKKDLMARLVLPSTLVEGDTQSVFANISNTTDRAMTVTSLCEVQGSDVLGELNRQVSLRPGQTTSLEWRVAPKEAGTMTVKVTVVESGGQGASDALEQTVPIKVHGRRLVTTEVGQTLGSKSLTVTRQHDAVSGKLVVTASPTLLGWLVQALPSLVDYPYGCTEQTMSRFVPAVLVVKLMHEQGLDNPEVSVRLPKIVRDSLTRLKRLQAGGGGWGWWEYDEPDPWMTAYVLEGLWRVRGAGVDVGSIDLGPTLEWSEKALKESQWQARLNSNRQVDQVEIDRLNNGCQLASALLLHKASAPAISAIETLLKGKSLSNESLSRIVVSLRSTKQRPDLLAAAYKSLMSKSTSTKDTLHWQDLGWYQETGSALEAVSLMEPQGDKVARILRYLSATRKGDIWTSTRDTARIIVSAGQYLRSSRELRPSLDVEIWINGLQKSFKRFTGQDVAAKPFRFEMSVADLQTGVNKIELRCKGQGRLYYTSELSQDVRVSNMAAVSTTAKFTLKREFFRVAPTRMDDGFVRMKIGSSPVLSARSGEVLRCVVTVTSKVAVDNVMIEVPMPSNMRIVDEEDPLDGFEWSSWWDKTLFFDDRAVFFGTVAPGTPQVIEFAVRAESPGSCQALPSVAFPMYQPDERAETSEQKFGVSN